MNVTIDQLNVDKNKGHSIRCRWVALPKKMKAKFLSFGKKSKHKNSYAKKHKTGKKAILQNRGFQKMEIQFFSAEIIAC